MDIQMLAPCQEYLLQGSILEQYRDVLLHRLNGLCDSNDTVEKFHDHEMVYHMKGVGAQPTVVFRVRRAIDHPEAPWHLRYLGQAEVGDKSKHTLVRTITEVGASDNVSLFLTEMGFKLDHEFTVKGYLFRKGRMKISVSKIFRMPHAGNVTDDLEAVTKSYLVELSVVATAGQDQGALQTDMKNFSEQLKPLVQLEKVDHRRLQAQMS